MLFLHLSIYVQFGSWEVLLLFRLLDSPNTGNWSIRLPYCKSLDDLRMGNHDAPPLSMTGQHALFHFITGNDTLRLSMYNAEFRVRTFRRVPHAMN